MTKRTYKPSKKRRSRSHGFRKRSRSKSGVKIIKRRRNKARKIVSH